MGLLEHIVILFLFLRNLYAVFQVATPIYIPMKKWNKKKIEMVDPESEDKFTSKCRKYLKTLTFSRENKEYLIIYILMSNNHWNTQLVLTDTNMLTYIF